MKKLLASVAIATCSGPPFGAAPAAAYQIDCAILLCLAGGWPSAGACIPARAEFIRRITPWPVEPPLQIWRCPMSAAFDAPTASPVTRLYDAAYAQGAVSLAPAMRTDEPARLPAPAKDAILRNVVGEGADIDISDPVFDFVRSIRVFDVDWWEYDHENQHGDHDCRRWKQRVRVGTYGLQGDFSWRDSDPGDAQGGDAAWFGFHTRADNSCSHAGRFRGVGVEWRDHEGNHGYEVVRY